MSRREYRRMGDERWRMRGEKTAFVEVWNSTDDRGLVQSPGE